MCLRLNTVHIILSKVYFTSLENMIAMIAMIALMNDDSKKLSRGRGRVQYTTVTLDAD